VAFSQWAHCRTLGECAYDASPLGGFLMGDLASAEPWLSGKNVIANGAGASI
jgi:hypothetical protein